MSSHSGRGVTAGTPIPRFGERPQVNNAVKEYTLSPEELERYRNLGKPKSQEKQGFKTFSQVRAEEERDGKMGTFTLTREQYLQERKTKTRAQIIKEQGITPPALIYHLRQWGLKDSVVEERELARLDKPEPVKWELTMNAHSEAAATVEAPEPITEPSEENASSEYAQPVDNVVDNSVDNTTSSVQEDKNEPRYVTIRIPVQHMELPDVINTKDLDRGELLEAAFRVAQASVSWAYNDLVELIGEDEVAAHIQKYVDRKWAAYREQVVTA